MLSPHPTAPEDAAAVDAALLDDRELEASRRLLQKLPPLHAADESPSESEVRSAQVHAVRMLVCVSSD
jgi:hypothetical protein